ncbi:MAG: hypothetical protein ACLF0G_13685 [Candidatus Brocadiia bacterium]
MTGRKRSRRVVRSWCFASDVFLTLIAALVLCAGGAAPRRADATAEAPADEPGDGPSRDQKAGLPLLDELPQEISPVHVMLVGGKALPLEEPYFKIDTGLLPQGGDLVPAVQYTRVRDGEPLDAALGPEGWLHARLEEIDPQKQYVWMLVCPDAIDACRRLRREVRRRGIGDRWTPLLDEPIVATAGGSGHWTPPE